MADELIFYTNPMSRGRIVRWMLEEAGAAYRTEILDYDTTMKGADYLAVNPMGKVPAVRRGGGIVTECAAICAWLADIFPEASLAPPPAERAAYYRWLFFAAGPLEAAVTNRAMGFAPGEEQRRMSGYGSYEAARDALAGALAGGGYIAGEAFTAADVYVGSHVGWGLQFGTLDRLPEFEAYWARLEGRPARRRAEELDNAAVADG